MTSYAQGVLGCMLRAACMSCPYVRTHQNLGLEQPAWMECCHRQSPCLPGMGHRPPVSSPDASVVAIPPWDVAFTLGGIVPHSPGPFMGAMIISNGCWPPALVASGGMLPRREFDAKPRRSRLTRSEETPANQSSGMVPAGFKLSQQSPLEVLQKLLLDQKLLQTLPSYQEQHLDQKPCVSLRFLRCLMMQMVQFSGP